MAQNLSTLAEHPIGSFVISNSEGGVHECQEKRGADGEKWPDPRDNCRGGMGGPRTPKAWRCLSRKKIIGGQRLLFRLSRLLRHAPEERILVSSPTGQSYSYIAKVSENTNSEKFSISFCAESTAAIC